jgi:hypothetical protein
MVNASLVPIFSAAFAALALAACGDKNAPVTKDFSLESTRLPIGWDFAASTCRYAGLRLNLELHYPREADPARVLPACIEASVTREDVATAVMGGLTKAAASVGARLTTCLASKIIGKVEVRRLEIETKVEEWRRC